ncbi:MAG: replication-associated recombination protein A [Sphingobacteriales bacterium]|nr:replication-associated recombination protein A [Sphingobacteriales bacterium]
METKLTTPLAERLRPQSLDDFIGQEHLVGKNAILRKTIESGHIPSMIFWGPPGVGKTTLANIIAKRLDKRFFGLSAIQVGVKEVREVIEIAKKSNQVILFLDEIHRFNKGQQDALLGAIEKGLILFIGATTENPSFEVNTALLSRCQVYILKELDENHLKKLFYSAFEKDEYLKQFSPEVKEWDALLRYSGGDARKLLNIIELIVNQHNSGKLVFDNKTVVETIQQNLATYDKSGEMHYDLISAFIKSMRGSDPNAAVYYLARMLAGGEDPKFIARRMLILASEDIGNANPNALLLANNCFQAIDVIGMPEARIILSQTAIYLACSPKSNSSYMAIEQAMAEVARSGDLPVPLHLRNAPTRLMKKIGYGKNYQYAHDFEGNFVNLEFLPEAISGKKFFEPSKNPREEEIRKHLRQLWKNKYGY